MARYDAEWAAIEAADKVADKAAEDAVEPTTENPKADPFAVAAEFLNCYLVNLDHTVLTARDAMQIAQLLIVAIQMGVKE